jgi:hypothetical protein
MGFKPGNPGPLDSEMICQWKVIGPTYGDQTLEFGSVPYFCHGTILVLQLLESNCPKDCLYKPFLSGTIGVFHGVSRLLLGDGANVVCQLENGTFCSLIYRF